jgi:hypothetical protein
MPGRSFIMPGRSRRDPEEPTPEELEAERQEMAAFASDPRHKKGFEKLLRLAADKGDTEQVVERLGWGIDPNCRSPKRQRTPLIRSCVSYCPMASVVEALLKAGADASLTDRDGLTGLDYVRRRLIKFEGKPRKPVRKSPSLLPNGDVRLSREEHEELDRMREEHPESADEFEIGYLTERRKAAEKVFDTRGELEKILPILESVERRG